MKKTFIILFYTLFCLVLLYPAGVITSSFFGYTFELLSLTIFAAFIALISLFTFVMSIKIKEIFISNTFCVFAGILAPLSLISNAFFVIGAYYFSLYERTCVIVSMFITSTCCVILLLRHSKPGNIKSISLILSVLICIPVNFLDFTAFAFGQFGEDTVVKNAESPSGAYFANVIASSQGALGGDTVVNVFDSNKDIDLILVKLTKKPQQVYFGEWYEFEDMEIYWKSDDCLVINSKDYKIK